MTGQPGRGINYVLTVNASSALLNIPGETSIPVARNHSDIAKIISPTDLPYLHLKTELLKFLDLENTAISTAPHPPIVAPEVISDCIEGLNLIDYETDRNRRLKLHQKGTCEWILRDERYLNWTKQAPDRPSRVLWISGPAGFGKSIMSAFLTEKLQDDNPNVVVAYFFCSDRDSRMQTGASIVTHWLGQLLRKFSGGLTHFLADNFFREAKDKAKYNWELEPLCRILDRFLEDRRAPAMCLFVDGLDECEADSRKVFLECLEDMFANMEPEFERRLVIISRPEIGRSVKDSFPEVIEIPLDSQQVNPDIERYIKSKMKKHPFTEFLPDLRIKVERTLLEKAGGMFLWTKLVIQDLATANSTTEDIERTLEVLPKDLPEYYSRILARIDEHAKKGARDILLWVVMALKPLTESELATAITVLRKEYESLADFEKDVPLSLWLENQPFSPLLTFTIRMGYDYASKSHVDRNEIGLIHQSVKDYFTTGEGVKWLRSTEKIPEDFDAHGEIAKACLDYLSLIYVDKRGREDPEGSLPDYLDYDDQDIRVCKSSFDRRLLDYSYKMALAHFRQRKTRNLDREKDTYAKFVESI